MLRRFLDNIAEQHLFSSEQEVLLAVSGGRDSVAMVELFRQAGLRFAVAHCNFHLRERSTSGDASLADCDRDQLFVRRLAQGLGVPFFTADFDTRAHAAAHGQSIEEAARHLRYAFFAELCVAHGYACVATAHHSDDSVETFFLNLLRGTGIAGLQGIRPSSSLALPAGTLRVVHPMLPFSRAEVDAFVAAHGLDYVDDYTNSHADVRRNQLRLQVLPMLRQLSPAFDTVMRSNMTRLADAGRIYADRVAALRQRLVQPFDSPVPGLEGQLVSLSMSGLAEVEPRRTLLFELLRPYGFTAETADALLSPDTRPGALFGSPTHEATLQAGRLVITPRAVCLQRWSLCAVPCAATVGAPLPPTEVVVDASLVRQPLVLRPWAEADRFCPFGMQGARLVSDFLKDMKISRLERRHVRLLVDADGRVVWVVGLRADNRFRLTPGTTRALRLRVVPGATVR